MANSNPDGALDVAVARKPNRVRPAILVIFNNPLVRTPPNDKAKRSRQSVRDSLLQVRKSLKRLVPRVGVEPTRPCGQRILRTSLRIRTQLFTIFTLSRAARNPRANF